MGNFKITANIKILMYVTTVATYMTQPAGLGTSSALARRTEGTVARVGNAQIREYERTHLAATGELGARAIAPTAAGDGRRVIRSGER